MSAASGTTSGLTNGVSAAVAASPMDSAPKVISNSNNMEAVTSSSASVAPEGARLNGSHAGTGADAIETPEPKSAVPETARSGATAAATTVEVKEMPKPAPSSPEGPAAAAAAAQPLPTNLRRILAEVAKTGTCSWLSWQTSKDNPTKDSIMKESKGAVGGATYAQSTGSSSTAAELVASSAASVSAAAAATAAANSSQGVSGKAPAPPASNSSLPGNTTSNNNNVNATNTTKYALGMAIPASRAQSRRPYTHFNNVPKAGSTRKKHRSSNGMKVSRRRLQQHEAGIAAGSKTATQTAGGAAAAGGRKRPLYLIRTSAGGAAQNVFSPGSVGSGRTSGSEPDDSTTQYECDSEGTSSCSELSTERRDHQLRNMQRISLPGESNKPPTASTDEVNLFPDEYHCLRDVFRMSLGLVLDHWYTQKGGYKLSPAERRRNRTTNADNRPTPVNAASSSSTVNGEKTQNPNLANGSHSTSTDKGASPSSVGGPQNVLDNASSAPQVPSSSSTDVSKKASTTESAEVIFSQRRRRLLIMLGQTGDKARANPPAIRRFQAADDDGPPFTIQRIAEVLIAPDRVSYCS